MPFASWWRGDPLPDLPLLPGLSIRRVAKLAEAQRVTSLSEHRVTARMQDGNTLYAAYLNAEPAGYGWLARQVGRISELSLTFTLPPGNAYLWDFVTQPAFRGRGVYPQLLQAIIAEEAAIQRFWIGYDARNIASGRGISKAGFQIVGEPVIQAARLTALQLDDRGERGQAILDLFELPAAADA